MYCSSIVWLKSLPPSPSPSPSLLSALFVTGVCHPSAPDSFNNNLRLTGSSGTLHSPDYPSKYPPSMSCVWVITVPNGKRVKLTFDDFSTESNYPCGGNGDFVEVRDGRYSYSRKTGTYCGKSTPSVVRSSDRYMWVKFNSDSDSATYRGFKAHYKAEDKECKSVACFRPVLAILDN